VDVDVFSVRQKQIIAGELEKLLRSFNHPEMQGPDEPLKFHLHIGGKYDDSWADIEPNSAVPVPDVNPFNESLDKDNQCDGCRTGMPIESGIHRLPNGSPYMCCTKNRY
jgi:hypothetical protein